MFIWAILAWSSSFPAASAFWYIGCFSLFSLYYKKEQKKDNKEIEKLSNAEGLEKYAREEYQMKKENEEIYLIEYEDSVAKQKKDE